MAAGPVSSPVGARAADRPFYPARPSPAQPGPARRYSIRPITIFWTSLVPS